MHYYYQMTKGHNESFYNFKLTKGDDPSQFYCMSTDITKEHGIPKNSIYSIIKKKPNMRKFKDFTIEKCKLPVYVYQRVYIPYDILL